MIYEVRISQLGSRQRECDCRVLRVGQQRLLAGRACITRRTIAGAARRIPRNVTHHSVDANEKGICESVEIMRAYLRPRCSRIQLRHRLHGAVVGHVVALTNAPDAVCV